MNPWNFRRNFCAAIASAALFLCAGSSLQAQGTEGFDTIAPALSTGEERTGQSNLWVLEVAYKSLRMISVETRDPATGKNKKEFVWYLVYRAINRPVIRQDDVADLTPQNTYDTPPGPPVFAPELTLVSNDNGVQKIYDDVIMPAAQAAIIKRERRALKNSVDVVGPIPPVSPYEEKPIDPIYGVAIWRNIDPETDYFTVIMTGFSNGYQIAKGPDGKPLILRKTLVQKYWRPGDVFDQDEAEIRPEGEPRWIYRAAESTDLPVGPAADDASTAPVPPAENP